jgi:hypothetical protein
VYCCQSIAEIREGLPTLGFYASFGDQSSANLLTNYN